MNHLTDTIIAPATPQGQSAIAVIRLSGHEAIAITDHIFKGKKLSEADSHTIHYGLIVDGEKEIDEVMVSVFRAPKTFTTEDSTEISCHGSPQLVQSIISLAIKHGAKSAFPGEFTLRAFLNGRLDLSQAEAVADLIHASSTKSSEIALNQLKGHFSSMLKDLRQELIDFAALIELELDFSEEDVEFAHRGRLNDLIHKIITVHMSFSSRVFNKCRVAKVGAGIIGFVIIIHLAIVFGRKIKRGFIIPFIAVTNTGICVFYKTIIGINIRFIIATPATKHIHKTTIIIKVHCHVIITTKFFIILPA